MNQQIKQRWLARLRSGQHGQCRQLLHVIRAGRPCFCVAGELVDLYIEDHPDEGDWTPSNTKGLFNYKGVESIAPPMVVRWAGLESFQLFELTQRNDGFGDHPRHTLAELADWIEQNIPGDDGRTVQDELLAAASTSEGGVQP